MIIKLIHWITLDRIFEKINDWIKLTFIKTLSNSIKIVYFNINGIIVLILPRNLVTQFLRVIYSRLSCIISNTANVRPRNLIKFLTRYTFY